MNVQPSLGCHGRKGKAPKVVVESTTIMVLICFSDILQEVFMGFSAFLSIFMPHPMSIPVVFGTGFLTKILIPNLVKHQTDII